MCGRFSQHRTAAEYLKALGCEVPLADALDSTPIGRYNVAPGTRVLILHRQPDGLHLQPVAWGYAPFWAQGKRPPAINARMETVASSRFFRGIWASGRALVAADGWYEWKKDAKNPKRKQPYFIRLKSGEPMFFAAMARRPEGEAAEPGDDGFVIITAATDTGLLDIHDRRPLVLPPDVAREWLEPGLPSERAEELLRYHGQPTEAFEWFPVNRAVGNVRNEGPDLIVPISDPLL